MVISALARYLSSAKAAKASTSFPFEFINQNSATRGLLWFTGRYKHKGIKDNLDKQCLSLVFQKKILIHNNARGRWAISEKGTALSF